MRRMLFPIVLVGLIVRGAAAGLALPESPELMRAMVDELARSMAKLELDDLPRPYLIEFKAQDRLTHSIRAAYGGIVQSQQNRMRVVGSRVRVGSFELDNTNVGRRFGRQAPLPIDDDYTAIRHAIWKVADADYKHAVEVLARKQAYLSQKIVEDRPDDYAPVAPLVEMEPPAAIDFDLKRWEENVRRLSARFKRHPEIQNAAVSFYVGAVNQWIVNSEGTRLRTADTGVSLEIHAEIQALDGMRLADGESYLGLQLEDLAPMEALLADVDALCDRLIALAKAPVLEQYTGPVLLEPKAAGKAFESLLGDRFCARPIPLGGGDWGDRNFERKLGLRILPRSFEIHDDPTQTRFDGKVLAGAYSFDDEAIRPKRVSLVEKGRLKTLLAARAPTRKIKGSTGHGRSAGFRDARSSVGCLYVTDSAAMTAEELKKTMIEAARDEGLDFALRVVSMKAGGSGGLGDPVYAYKVYVEDGREELVRGLEFLAVESGSLKRLLAAGKEPEVYNALGRVSSSYIVPAIVFEELDLRKIERELDKLPIAKSPLNR